MLIMALAPCYDPRMSDDTAAVDFLRNAIPGLIAVYRFGSSVTATEHLQSDLDFAVLSPRPLDPVRRFEMEQDLAHHLHRAVDLVDLRRASTVMRVQVVSRGTLLFESDEAERARFEMYAYSDYARLNEERRPILERIAREGTIHGR
jgi:predicted nucleotidyltransferase